MGTSIRKAGILLHPSSLPGKFGIGTLGSEAYEFVDFLVKSRIGIWQILPLGPTGFGNSPYQCFSAFAGNPLLIDLAQLNEMGLILNEDFVEHGHHFNESDAIDFEEVEIHKMALLRKAYQNFRVKADQYSGYRDFCYRYADILNDYSLFMSIKAYYGGCSMSEWPLAIRRKEPEAIVAIYDKLIEEVGFQKFIQWLFFKQWMQLKRYANERGVDIMGDIPIYVSCDSADLWSSPEYFDVDENLIPKHVAGVPPDYFSQTGQMWGNPVYNWKAMQADDFAWWRRRIWSTFQMYNSFRIDHFRGFSQFWAIPAGDKTAVNGVWVDAPGLELFQSIERHLGKMPIIAEDLGLITPDVENLRDSFGFPGMKILQFAFDSSENNIYLPHTFNKNCVVYTGTHDNNTTLGWYYDASKQDLQKSINYMDCEGKSFVRSMIRQAFSSVADTAVIPMQDLLELGAHARMNIPGTIADNWQWKMVSGQMDDCLAQDMAAMNTLFGRGLAQ